MPDRAVDLTTVAVQVTFLLPRWPGSVSSSRTSSRCFQKQILRWGALKDTNAIKNGSFRSHQIKFITTFIVIYDENISSCHLFSHSYFLFESFFPPFRPLTFDQRSYITVMRSSFDERMIKMAPIVFEFNL